jgi:hypothetical protein
MDKETKSFIEDAVKLLGQQSFFNGASSINLYKRGKKILKETSSQYICDVYKLIDNSKPMHIRQFTINTCTQVAIRLGFANAMDVLVHDVIVDEGQATSQFRPFYVENTDTKTLYVIEVREI